MSKLIIVESPAKAKTIKNFLGRGYDVIASRGHIRDLPKSSFGIKIEDGEFKPENAAYEIIDKKGATFYAIALAVKRITECIIGDEKSILTVSSMLEGEYGISDICLSLPTVVGADGAERILEIDFSDEEISGLKSSAEKMKSLAAEIGF